MFKRCKVCKKMIKKQYWKIALLINVLLARPIIYQNKLTVCRTIKRNIVALVVNYDNVIKFVK